MSAEATVQSDVSRMPIVAVPALLVAVLLLFGAPPAAAQEEPPGERPAAEASADTREGGERGFLAAGALFPADATPLPAADPFVGVPVVPHSSPEDDYRAQLFGKLRPDPAAVPPASIYGTPFRAEQGRLRLGWDEAAPSDGETAMGGSPLDFLGGRFPLGPGAGSPPGAEDRSDSGTPEPEPRRP